MSERLKTLDEIEKVRRKAKNGLSIAGVLVIIRLFFAAVFFAVPPDAETLKGVTAGLSLVAMTLTYLAFIMTVRALKSLHLAWRSFYTRRYFPFVLSLLEEGYAVPWTVSKWRFFRELSLKKFEETLIEGLRAARRTIDDQRRKAKWEAASKRLRPQLDALLDAFSATEEERDQATQDFDSFENPRRKREFLDRLGHRLVHDRWRREMKALESAPATLPKPERPQEEDVELRSFLVRAAQLTSPQAQALYRQALEASSRREKIRLLGALLNLEAKENGAVEKVEGAKPTISAPPAEIKQLSLREFARERLKVLEQLVSKDKADWRMCREIILILLEPGRSTARINKRYFAEDTIKVEVRRQYQLSVGQQFDPSAFKDAVKLLLDYNVLVKKPKTDERAISLSTRVKGAANKEAAAIISAFLQLKREARGFV